jgi:transposase-like protein
MGLRKNFKQKFEQIYDARAVKEALIEWESVRERYDNSLTL